MREYHKIQSVYKRDPITHKFIDGEWSLPEFDYLAECEWEWTEKVDGTNIRVIWDDMDKLVDYEVIFKGKTDNAQIPASLVKSLQDLFPSEKFRDVFDSSVCLYGEGYGNRIQKVGSLYKPDGVSFVLFDILIGEWWLKREDVIAIAAKMGIEVVPTVDWGTLWEAIMFVKKGFNSNWGAFPAEGLVCRPKVDLRSRDGHRIITKIKTKDFI
jgi:hypothetical protein